MPWFFIALWSGQLTPEEVNRMPWIFGLIWWGQSNAEKVILFRKGQFYSSWVQLNILIFYSICTRSIWLVMRLSLCRENSDEGNWTSDEVHLMEKDFSVNFRREFSTFFDGVNLTPDEVNLLPSIYDLFWWGQSDSVWGQSNAEKFLMVCWGQFKSGWGHSNALICNSILMRSIWLLKRLI